MYACRAAYLHLLADAIDAADASVGGARCEACDALTDRDARILSVLMTWRPSGVTQGHQAPHALDARPDAAAEIQGEKMDDCRTRTMTRGGTLLLADALSDAKAPAIEGPWKGSIDLAASRDLLCLAYDHATSSEAAKAAAGFGPVLARCATHALLGKATAQPLLAEAV